MELAGLYLHVPFCGHLCPYCDFAVLTGGVEAQQRFVEHLIGELRLVDWHGPSFDTVYLGGGTPSALAPALLERILDAARRWQPIEDDAWITLEANPEDVTAECAAAWRLLGVRTVSLGVQSLDGERLAFLGRRHRPEAASRAVDLCRSAGLTSLSLDLIFGAPDQGAASWSVELAAAVALRPEHISCYQLTVEPGTLFGVRARRGELLELDDEGKEELFLLTHQQLEKGGYEAYEVSNFASAPQHRSRHNQKYWSHAPYLGVGPSAHSFDGVRRRWWNERRLRGWQEALARRVLPIAGEEHLDDRSLALEALMLGLRRRRGVDLAEVRRRTGIDLLGRDFEQHRKRRRLRLVDGYLVPTLKAMLIADSIARDWQIEPG